MNSNEEIKAPLIQNSRASNLENSTDTEKYPIEQVALTVPTTDDPSLPCFTFRTWILGSLACVVLSFLNQFFWYRKESLSLTSISAQIAMVPLGHHMASTITERVFFKGRKFEFTLNPVVSRSGCPDSPGATCKNTRKDNNDGSPVGCLPVIINLAVGATINGGFNSG
nr:oligopeptide transporter 7 [Quercus suber]